MLAWLSVASLVVGVLFACLAERLPLRTADAELIGGLLIVLGLVLVGIGLSPLFR